MEGFFPGKKYGGPPVSVDNFCSLMQDDHCYIVATNHDMGENESYSEIENKKWLQRENSNIMYLSDSDYTRSTFESIILEIRPDIIYLQGLFQACILPCLILAKTHNIRVMLAPRGELCAGAFRKKYKKMPYISFLRINGLLKNVSFQSTSNEETEKIQKYLGVDGSRVFSLSNIPSIPSQTYDRKGKEPGNAALVFISRIHPKKNLMGAIRYLASLHGNISFDIYGPIEDEDYWNTCQNEIAKLPSNIKVKYSGLISHENVHETFSRYDAFLFPTLSENYGHVIAESLFVGTPVIISDQTPWTDINDYNAGFAVNLSDESGFITAIQKIVDSTNDEMKKMIADSISYVKKKTDIEHIREKYTEAFRSAKNN